MTYCFVCRVCGLTVERPNREKPYDCPRCEGVDTFRRNWMAEGVGLGNITELRKDREGNGAAALRDRFLPSTADFASPADPDGEKGMRTWLEEHGPRETNKRPLYPEHKKVVF